jgi:hypothetical protein
MLDEPKSAQEVWKDPVSSIHMKKTGDLETGRFKPIEEPGAEEKDPVVFTSYRIQSWLVLLRRFYLTLRSQCLLIWLPFLPGFLLWKLAIGSLFPRTKSIRFILNQTTRSLKERTSLLKSRRRRQGHMSWPSGLSSHSL